MKTDKATITLMIAATIAVGCIIFLSGLAASYAIQAERVKDTLLLYRQQNIRAIDSGSGTVAFLKGKGVYKPGDCVWANDSLNIVDIRSSEDRSTLYLYVVIPQ